MRLCHLPALLEENPFFFIAQGRPHSSPAEKMNGRSCRYDGPRKPDLPGLEPMDEAPLLTAGLEWDILCTRVQ